MNRQIMTAVIVALVVGFSCGAAATYSWLRAPQGDQYADDHEGDVPGDNIPEEDEHGDVVRLTQTQIEELGIEVGTAGPGSLHFKVSLPGEVVLNPDSAAHIVARSPGVAVEIKKRVGDRVEAGEVIRDMILSSMPLSRMGTVDDIVGACLFLLSDEASWITAQVLAVDGGQIMRA